MNLHRRTAAAIAVAVSVAAACGQTPGRAPPTLPVAPPALAPAQVQPVQARPVQAQGVQAPRVVVWDGEQAKVATHWAHEGVSLEQQTAEAHSGDTALEFRVKSTADAWVGAGWNWCAFKYCPQMDDGEWHEVTIPLADLKQPAGFDPRHVGELQMFCTGAGDGSIFIDDIAFETRTVAQ